MIKVLFMIHDLGHGGAEKVLVNLVNNMNPEKFDISVTALFGGGVNEQFLKEHIHYRAIFNKTIPGNSKIMKLFTPKQLHRLFIKERYDIEISYLEGPAARIISGCPYSATRLISWIHVQQYNKRIAAKAFRSYAESVACYKKFDNIVAVSHSVQEDFQRIYPMISDVDVLYNTNETDQILELKDESIEAGIFHEGEIRLIGVGKLMPIKGFDRLAKIHRKLRQENYPVHTYVLGEGPEREKIEKYLEDNKLKDSFTLLGYQKNPYKYVSKCDLFVCMSTSEGFSTAATEALIVGTPVVTTPVAGMEEMLGSNNEYGIIGEFSLSKMYEEIKNLLDNHKQLDFYKGQAKKRGKNFSKDNTVSAVEQYLTQGKLTRGNMDEV